MFPVATLCRLLVVCIEATSTHESSTPAPPCRTAQAIVRGERVTLRWSLPTFDDHYARHPCGGDDSREELCWSDLENMPGRQVDERRYEQRSFAVIHTPTLHFRLREDRDGDWFHHFVDHHLVVSITTVPDSDANPQFRQPLLRMTTCFHAHKHHGTGDKYDHISGYHRNTPTDEQIRSYKLWLNEERTDNKWGIHWYERGSATIG